MATIQDSRLPWCPAMTTPDGPFWELVKAEILATWNGELRWLWRVLAVLFTSDILWVPTNDLGLLEVYLTPAWFFLTVTPIVLGSDLLSLAFPSNPQPGRPWPFRAILARAVGRLLPWLVPACAMHYSWLARFTAQFGLGRSPVDGSARGDMLGYLAMALHMPTMALLAFTLAACASMALRRPNRVLVTGLVQSVLAGVAFALFAAPIGFGEIPRGAVVAVTMDPLHHVTVVVYNKVLTLIGLPAQVTVPTPGWIHMLFPLMVGGVSLLLWAWIRTVVEARVRRHPFQVDCSDAAGKLEYVPEAIP
jgi:hypothetical protein